jgi:hypothetical protein
MKTTENFKLKLGRFLKSFWLLLKDYPGFLLYIFSVLMIYLMPFFWANGDEIAFKGALWFVFALFLGLYVWIVIRLSGFSKYSSSLIRLLGLLAEITLGFSAIYMWMIFFDPIGQFEGVKNYQAIFKSTIKSDYLTKKYLLEVLKLMVDCNHFSIVSATTVGYGDIYPKNQFARLLVDFQLGYTFTIVAIGIGKYSDRKLNPVGSNVKAATGFKKAIIKYRALQRTNKGVCPCIGKQNTKNHKN